MERYGKETKLGIIPIDGGLDWYIWTDKYGEPLIKGHSHPKDSDYYQKQFIIETIR